MSHRAATFFKQYVSDKHIPEAQIIHFFVQAYLQSCEDPNEQLRLLDLLKLHRGPEVERKASRRIIEGY